MILIPPDKHTTRILADTNNLTIFSRSQDSDKYNVISRAHNTELKEVTQHIYYLEPPQTDSVYSFSWQFLKTTVIGNIQKVLMKLKRPVKRAGNNSGQPVVL